MTVGRPSEYTPEKADEICARIAEGETVRSVCLDDEMPSTATFYKWLRENEEFLKLYTRAKEEQIDALIEEILDISDDGTNDWMERRDKDGNNIGWQENGEALRRSQLRIETRKWLATKLKPKKYGDRTTLASDPDSPFKVVVQREIITSNVSDT